MFPGTRRERRESRESRRAKQVYAGCTGMCGLYTNQRVFRDCGCAGNIIYVVSTLLALLEAKWDNIPYALKKRMSSVKNFFIQMATKNTIKVARDLKRKIALKVTDKITFFERIAE